MLALCLMLLVTYYAFNYASIIGLGLPLDPSCDQPRLTEHTILNHHIVHYALTNGGFTMCISLRLDKLSFNNHIRESLLVS